MHDEPDTVFDVERRIERSAASVRRVLISEAVLVPGTRIEFGPDRCLTIDGVLRVAVVPGPTTRTLRTTGHLVERGRRLADVEIEVGVAAARVAGGPGPDATVLVMRPRHRRPRWRAGRRRRYAGIAAACADRLSSAIAGRVPEDLGEREAGPVTARAS